MTDIVLRADGGQMTVGRRVAGFVWGRWDVNLPNEVELENEIDKRMAEGFLYRPEGMGVGRFDLLGVRADSSQTMAVKTNGDLDYELGSSNTEQVLDAAEKRVDGDVFFEKDITAAGLGPYVPGVDFQEDDLVDVVIWGKRITGPVTAINVVRERGSADSWLVHFGGQPIADAEKLRSSNDQIWAVIASERREAAERIQSVEAHSRETRAGLTGSPTGDLEAAVRDRSTLLGRLKGWSDDAMRAALLAQEKVASSAKELAGDISQLVSSADFREYSQSLQERLWGAQGELNKLNADFQEQQVQINAAQEQVNEQNRRITSVQSEALSRIQSQQLTLTGATETLQRRVPAVLAVSGDYGGNEYLSYEKSGNDLMVTAKPGWSGVFVASIRVSALASFSVHLSGQVGPQRSFSFSVGAFERFSGGFILILPS